MLVSLTTGMYRVQPHLEGKITCVRMHNGIVNGYQLLCNAHTVLEPHMGTAAFFFFTHYRPFPLFLFMCLSLLTVLFLVISRKNWQISKYQYFCIEKKTKTFTLLTFFSTDLQWWWISSLYHSMVWIQVWRRPELCNRRSR